VKLRSMRFGLTRVIAKFLLLKANLMLNQTCFGQEIRIRTFDYAIELSG